MNNKKDELNSAYYQHTLNDSFTCVSRGLHTGLKIVMRVTPAEPNSGIVFVRRDVDSRYSEIEANWRNVSDTRMSTTISNSIGIRVSTIEHLMAALYASGIDNARILLDGPEVPIMDGSAVTFVQFINQVGKCQQDAERHVVIIEQAISVSEGNKSAGFLPSPVPWMDLIIDFESSPIGRQTFSSPITSDAFEEELAPARTFGFKEQINTLHKLGLAQGGSLSNAVLIDDNKIVNEEGLRFHDEFVRHKMVDSIGDIALVGSHIVGQFTSVCSGHKLNNALIQKLMANEHAWRFVTMHEAMQHWKVILQSQYNDTELAEEIMEKFGLYPN